jgi:anaerobic magnesium-protoporphyrin IX monomethyl ester cyclase
MRVLLVNPPWVIRSRKNVWRNVASIMPPLGLAWLAAVLERAGHDVEILDAHALRMELDDVVAWARGRKPFDLVGVTATTPLIGNALEIARQFKAESPSIRIVLGGVHPTVMPDEALAEPAVDVVVRGEGEDTICELAAGGPLENIDGISYRRDGQAVHNRDRALIADLDTLPLPAYHLLPMDKYRPAAGAAKRTPATSVLATRGCPGRCTFCYRIFGDRLRCRSGRRVAEEVKLLQERYGIREICFYDDTFTAVKREVRAFCQAVQDMKLDLTWSCFSRIDTFDEEVFRLMKQSGCHQVMVGVESASPEILKNINKKIDVERVATVIAAMKKLGLEVRAAFMLGNPGETLETMEENVRFAVRLNPDLAQFNITTPFPGTEMYGWAEANGCLMTKNWEDYDLSRPVLRLPTVAPEAVQRYYDVAHRRFFLRPSFILKRLWRLRNPREWATALRGLRMVLKI